jgi:hypothetical protein
MLVPFWTISQNTSTKLILNDLINLLSLSINLGVIGLASDEMGAQTLMQLLPKASNKDRSSVRNNSLRYAMIADDV